MQTMPALHVAHLFASFFVQFLPFSLVNISCGGPEIQSQGIHLLSLGVNYMTAAACQDEPLREFTV